MDKLQELIGLCKVSVEIWVDDHKVCYETAKERLFSGGIDLEYTSKEVVDKMVELDTIIDICFYPDTPIGSVQIYHYDLELGLQEALDWFNKGE